MPGVSVRWYSTATGRDGKMNNSNTQEQMNKMNRYEQDVLGALLYSLDFMKCNDMDCTQVEAAIEAVELTLKSQREA